jgi:hypothetical protein
MSHVVPVDLCHVLGVAKRLSDIATGALQAQSCGLRIQKNSSCAR